MADDRANKIRYFAEDGFTRYEEADRLRRHRQVSSPQQDYKVAEATMLATLSVAAFLAAAELRAAFREHHDAWASGEFTHEGEDGDDV